MATYKVLQDIEGEDHLILWLTPRQTIYAGITVVSCALAYVFGRLNILAAIPWLFPIAFFGFLAAPLGKDQPNDVWAAAQLRFLFKNRRRVWDQSGMQELVHITAPKRVEKIYTDGLDQGEVRSRLKALSTTIDSRGWAVKNSTVTEPVAPQFTSQFTQANEDRLVGSESLEQEVPVSDVTAADDIMDQINNSVAQRFDEEIKRQEQEHKEKIRQAVQTASKTSKPILSPEEMSFINSQQVEGTNTNESHDAPKEQLATFTSQVIAPGSQIESDSADDKNDPNAQALLEKIHHDQEMEEEIMSHTHTKVVKTPQQIAEEEAERSRKLAEQKRLEEEAEMQVRMEEEATQKARVSTAPDDILKELSRSELKVSTIATQAKHKVEATNEDGEVVISLH